MAAFVAFTVAGQQGNFTPFPLIRLQPIIFPLVLLQSLLFPGISQAKIDWNAHPALHRLIAVTRRRKTPQPDGFDGCAVQCFAAGCTAYLHGF